MLVVADPSTRHSTSRAGVLDGNLTRYAVSRVFAVVCAFATNGTVVWYVRVPRANNVTGPMTYRNWLLGNKGRELAVRVRVVVVIMRP